MNRTLLILSFVFAQSIYSQTNYKKIEEQKQNKEKVALANNFIKSYLDKCVNKNYSEFTNFNLSNGHKEFMDKKLSEICLNDEKNFGRIDLGRLNSVYKDKSSLVGGNELYIFDAKTEKNKDIKCLSVWISKKNQIDGMVITADKPFRKKK